LRGHGWRFALSLLAIGIAGTAAAALAVEQLAGGVGAGLGAAALLAAALTIAVDRLLSGGRRRLRRLRGALQAIGRGDMSHRLPVEAMGDLAAEAAALNTLAEAVGSTLGRMSGLTRDLQRLPDAIATAMAEIQQGAESQESAVEETASLLAHINSSIRAINAEVDHLARNNEETASSITEMGTAVEQVAHTAGDLQRSVEASTSAAHEMGEQIRRVAESSDSVQQMAEETAASIAQMDHAIRQVGSHVASASELSAKVQTSASEGSHAVGSTIEGIARIRSLSFDARAAIQGLDSRIAEIGQIATVIGGISDETNLLSLNAAIIAAQAGEHGRAFAVVAEQVKTLARRTTASTQQIGALIEAVQSESTNAVAAMAAGIEAVEEGVERSRVAGHALEAITAASHEANGRVAEIARAAEEQARNSRHVAAAAQQTSEHINQISAAMGDQRQAAELLLRNSVEAVEMCRQVTRATEEQRETGRYITGNVTAITDMIRSIQERTASHQRSSAGMADAVGTILDYARKSCEHIPSVAGAVAELGERATAMGAEMERFQSSAQVRAPTEP